MAIYLIKYWRYGAILGAIVLFALWIGNLKSKAEKYDAAKLQLETCQATAVKTKEANDDLQKSRDTIANRLAASKRVQRACIPIKSNAQQAGAEHARGDGGGITSEWLLEYASRCETYRAERIVLERFITQ